MNVKNIMELGAIADAVYSEHGESMQKAIFGDHARENPAPSSDESDPRKKMMTNAVMFVAGASAIWAVKKVMQG
jgi:hypothetical protein